MNEILKYQGLSGDDDDSGKNRVDWNHMTDSVLDALKAFFGKDGQNSNTNGQTPVNVTVQQDKTMLYIGLGCLALMGIFVLTNSGKK